MSIVTKTGDDGTTGLYGAARVSKASPRVHAYGDVDELNALLGLIVAEGIPEAMREGITRMQHELFTLGADLATPLSSEASPPRVGPHHVQNLEEWIKAWEQWLPKQEWFILPGGTKAAALFHLARTVCRRAERNVVSLMGSEQINPQVQVYLNRLSDCLFLLGRAANRSAGTDDVRVHYDAKA